MTRDPEPCDDCGFDPVEWNELDTARNLGAADTLVALWTEGMTDDARCVLAPLDSPSVHDLWHHLVDIARTRVEVGDATPISQGTVSQINVSDGGVPKLPVAHADIGPRGLRGDTQHARMHHGRPWQALCLWSTEVIASLRNEGHPIEAGSAGENLTLSGLDWPTLRAGTILDIGNVRCQLSAPAVPCAKNSRWFTDGDHNRILHTRHPGRSRWYASVLAPGDVVAGAAATVIA